MTYDIHFGTQTKKNKKKLMTASAVAVFFRLISLNVEEKMLRKKKCCTGILFWSSFQCCRLHVTKHVQALFRDKNTASKWCITLFNRPRGALLDFSCQLCPMKVGWKCLFIAHQRDTNRCGEINGKSVYEPHFLESGFQKGKQWFRT